MSAIDDYHASVFDKLFGNPMENNLMQSIPDRDDSLSAVEEAEREERIEARIVWMLDDREAVEDALASGVGIYTILDMLDGDPLQLDRRARLLTADFRKYFRPIAERYIDDYPNSLIDHELQRADRERDR